MPETPDMPEITDPLLAPLQLALFDALSAPGVITVYDTPPKGAALPYVSLGETRLSPSPSSGGYTLYEGTTEINVWSETDSQMELKESMDTVTGLLTEASITVPGYKLMEMRLTGASTSRQGRGSRHLHQGQLILALRLSASPSAV